MLVETSRFWMSRMDYDANRMPVLLNVMGPDEYTPMSRNNAYTNKLVAYQLRSVCAAAAYGKEKEPALWEHLAKRLSIEEKELQQFMEVAQKLKIPYDKERKLVLQCEDFEQYGTLDFDRLWTDRSKPFGCFVSQERIYRSRCIKQADVLALMSLFPQDYTEEEVQSAYDYYKDYTTHDSSLSPIAHYDVAKRLGRQQEMQMYLQKAIAVDMEGTGAEEGIHIANCAALWFALQLE